AGDRVYGRDNRDMEGRRSIYADRPEESGSKDKRGNGGEREQGGIGGEGNEEESGEDKRVERGDRDRGARWRGGRGGGWEECGDRGRGERAGVCDLHERIEREAEGGNDRGKRDDESPEVKGEGVGDRERRQDKRDGIAEFRHIGMAIHERGDGGRERGHSRGVEGRGGRGTGREGERGKSNDIRGSAEHAERDGGVDGGKWKRR